MKRLLALFLSIVLVLSTAIFPAVAWAEKKGKLESFEEKLEEPKKKPVRRERRKRRRRRRRRRTYYEEDVEAPEVVTAGVMQMLASFFLMGMMQQGSAADLYRNLKEKESPALPTIRIEPAYQYVAGGVHGFSGKVEAGYLMFGVDGEYLHYIERGPNANMKFIQGHFLLRTQFADIIGTNLALGVKSLWGDRRHTGFEFGIPFYVFITRNFILDVLPYWATIRGRDVYDIGGGLSYKYKLFGIRAGYRAISVSGETLHGPRVGLFFQW